MDIADPARLADKVWERDQGKCVFCGLEGMKIRAEAFPVIPHKMWLKTLQEREQYERDLEKYVNDDLPLARETRAKYPWLTPTIQVMQVDHIIPVVEGGGCCGIDNLRLLCHPCHAGETLKLRGRMKEARQA